MPATVLGIEDRAENRETGCGLDQVIPFLKICSCHHFLVDGAVICLGFLGIIWSRCVLYFSICAKVVMFRFC